VAIFRMNENKSGRFLKRGMSIYEGTEKGILLRFNPNL